MPINSFFTKIEITYVFHYAKNNASSLTLQHRVALVVFLFIFAAFQLISFIILLIESVDPGKVITNLLTFVVLYGFFSFLFLLLYIYFLYLSFNGILYTRKQDGGKHYIATRPEKTHLFQNFIAVSFSIFIINTVIVISLLATWVTLFHSSFMI